MENTTLQAGFGKVNVTPTFSVGLDGHSNYESRRSEGVADPIFVTCIAVKSGQETILIYTIDNLAFSNPKAEELRGMLTESTGIPGEKVFVGATHCHSCPALAMSDPPGKKYYDEVLLPGAVEAAKTALADLAPAALFTGKTELKGMNFIRHYITANGTIAGSNFGSFKDNPAVGYDRESDPRMILVKFAREGDKKSILMVNWQAHPDYNTGIGEYNISADFPGALRDKLSADADMLVAYFTGASGDQNPKSRVVADNHTLETYRDYGEKLAEFAYDALSTLKPSADTTIKTLRVMYPGEINHTQDHMLEQAREIYRVWKSEGNAAGNAKAREYGLTTRYEARGIINRHGMPQIMPLELNSFRIGDVGFMTGTMEMFSTTGIYARAHSPFENTFIITGCSGYIPCERAFSYMSYEAVSTFYIKGTAEKLGVQYAEMLNAVK